MPISFEQINSIPDTLPNNRHEVMFPSIQNSDGYALTLRHGHVTLPAATLGQVKVKFLGHSIAFAGTLATENSVTVSFLEDSEGTVLQALTAWMQIARNRETYEGGLKSEYAANGEVYMYDTRGEKVHTFVLYNMWPMVITYPDMVEESGPAEVEVQFSVDAVDLKAKEDSYAKHQTGKNSTQGSGDGYAYYSSPTSVDFGKSISNIGIDGSSFDVQRALQLGSFQLSPSNSIIPQNAFTVARFAKQFGSLFR